MIFINFNDEYLFYILFLTFSSLWLLCDTLQFICIFHHLISHASTSPVLVAQFNLWAVLYRGRALFGLKINKIEQQQNWTTATLNISKNYFIIRTYDKTYFKSNQQRGAKRNTSKFIGFWRSIKVHLIKYFVKWLFVTYRWYFDCLNCSLFF